MQKLEIKNFQISDLVQNKYINPVQISYTQNNVNKVWEAVEAHESVAILLYHKSKDAFLLVKQFRAPVYMNYKSHPYTYELCAGIVDKDMSLVEIIKEEILEECGYDVKIKDITKITSFFTNVGVSGSRQHLFYATIDDNLKVNDGGGLENEFIILEYLDRLKAKEFIYDETKAKTPGLMFSFYWFFEREKDSIPIT